jgi:hypothetical protein
MPTSSSPLPSIARPLPRRGEPCANCGAEVDAAYCGACGEQRRAPDALPPLQLFLLLNVVFFLAAPRLGLFRYGISREAAAEVVARAAGRAPATPAVPVPEAPALVEVVRRTGWSAAELRARFDRAAAVLVTLLLGGGYVFYAAVTAVTARSL